MGLSYLLDKEQKVSERPFLFITNERPGDNWKAPNFVSYAAVDMSKGGKTENKPGDKIQNKKIKKWKRLYILSAPQTSCVHEFIVQQMIFAYKAFSTVIQSGERGHMISALNTEVIPRWKALMKFRKWPKTCC